MIQWIKTNPPRRTVTARHTHEDHYEKESCERKENQKTEETGAQALETALDYLLVLVSLRRVGGCRHQYVYVC